jgi:D-sedoheptulose 7-phosphate isomerase
MKMNKEIKESLSASADLKCQMACDEELVRNIEAASEVLLSCVQDGGVIYVCGNGGSACDAMHFVEELVARFKRERPGIRAMHLLDAATISCWSNDYSYESAFERQVETFTKKEDVLVGISTSGNSKNILRAIAAANTKGAKSIALTGKSGGEAAKLAHLSIKIPSTETERVQEGHITVIHILCEILDQCALNRST